MTRKRWTALLGVFVLVAAALGIAAASGSARAAVTTTASAAARADMPPAITAAPAGSTFTQGALTGIHTKPLALTNGLCMYVPNTNVGQHIYLGNCSVTNQWDYFSNGQLSPSGHDNVAIADSGGVPVLKAEPTTIVDSDAVINNANGSYFELDRRQCVGCTDLHLYFHNNGNGNAIGGDNQMGNLANYYRMLAD